MFVKTVSKQTVSFEKRKLPVLDSKSKSFLQDVIETAIPISNKSNKRRMYKVIFVNVIIYLNF